MAKKRNSNYGTARATEAMSAKEKAAKKRKNAVILKRLAIAAVILVAIAGIVLGFAFGLGLFDYYPTATDHITMALTGQSTSLHIELYGDDAPVTVEHFKKLATDNYFSKNLLGFHTYKDGVLYFGSMTAGIDVAPAEKPEGDKKTYGIKGEFSDNGFENEIPFTRGTVGIMRGEENDSGYGQFFIVLEDKVELDGRYCAFGRIFEGNDGLDFVDKLVSDAESKGAIGEDGTIKVEERVLIGRLSSHGSDSH